MDGNTPRGGTGGGDLQRRRILEFAREFTRREGYSPSYREIGEKLGLGVSTVSYHVALLRQQGALDREPGRPRTITEPSCPVFPAGEDDADVPLLGQIAAGIPADMADIADEMYRLPRRLVGRGEVFMLRVKGDSMTGAAIIDGDLVVVRRQEDAENGEIVAARIGDEATVKTLQRRGGHAWLMPHNPAFQPIPADDAAIMGKVVSVLRPPGSGLADALCRRAARCSPDVTIDQKRTL
jgi:repressor LexA